MGRPPAVGREKGIPLPLRGIGEKGDSLNCVNFNVVCDQGDYIERVGIPLPLRGIGISEKMVEAVGVARSSCTNCFVINSYWLKIRPF